jgi:hypothetical protein
MKKNNNSNIQKRLTYIMNVKYIYYYELKVGKNTLLNLKTLLIHFSLELGLAYPKLSFFTIINSEFSVLFLPLVPLFSFALKSLLGELYMPIES